jgi:hypothetical protein
MSKTMTLQVYLKALFEKERHAIEVQMLLVARARVVPRRKDRVSKRERETWTDEKTNILQ